ncbi:hypothetical protein JVT61DRAFT_11263 [Boletus reticuloceps]|uniref:Uncharacterized protein n=1 Tax=Boletus reticuloceps TaxID=495285 RepID=A0A8I2YEZ9_9AGAM|nr:hypothetical protein JVT61DRAFT_11263 [Boletus reticuloceps]
MSPALEASLAYCVPQFQYDPIVSASPEFYRLCNESGWGRGIPKMNFNGLSELQRCLGPHAVVQGQTTISTNYGRTCAASCTSIIDPIPNGLPACHEARQVVLFFFSYTIWILLTAHRRIRQAVCHTFVDLVDTKTTQEKITYLFPSAR